MEESADNVIAMESAIVSAAVSLQTFGHSAANILLAESALVTCHDNNVLLTFDGSAPAANDGHLLVAPGTYSVVGSRMIRAMKLNKSGSNAAVTISLINRKAS